MKRGLLCAAALSLFCAMGCSAASHDFDSVVSGVEQRYSVHAQRIPMMGFISLCARVVTIGGVKGMRIAEFDNVGGVDARGLYSLMQSELGAAWQPMVTDRNNAGSNVSVIFVQPVQHSSMRMLIADYQNNELDVVRMELNGAAGAMDAPSGIGFWIVCWAGPPQRLPSRPHRLTRNCLALLISIPKNSTVILSNAKDLVFCRRTARYFASLRFHSGRHSRFCAGCKQSQAVS